MKAHKSLSFIFALLLSVVLLSLVSAADVSVVINPTPSGALGVNQNGTFTVTNNGNETINVSLSASSTEFTAGLSSLSILNLAAGATTDPIRVFVSNPSAFNSLSFGGHGVTVTATATGHSGSATDSKSFTFFKSFCNSGSVGNISIDSVSINSNGDDDTIWRPLDEVTVEVGVANDGDTSLSGIYVQLALYDSQGRNRISRLDFSNSDKEKLSYGTVRDGDTERDTFKFTIPVDLDSDNYRLAIKVYKSGHENDQCGDESDDLSSKFYEDINVEKQTDDGKRIIVDTIQAPDQATCGDTISGSFRLVNVGDQDEDQVLVNLLNRDFGVDQDFEVKENFNSGDEKTIDFSFPVPKTLTDKAYTLQFRTMYDYRDGVYRQTSDDTFTKTIQLVGCSFTSVQGAQPITATLSSSAEAGKDLIVTARVTNTGTSDKTYIMTADGYQSWSTLGSVSPRSLSLTPGSTQTVVYTLHANADVKGTQSFTILATDAQGSGVQAQDVQVSFGTPQQASGTSLSSLFGGSYLIWIVAAVNIILIILIVLVAIRLSRR